MTRRALVIVVALAIIAGGAFLLLKQHRPAPPPVERPSSAAVPSPAPAPAPAPGRPSPSAAPAPVRRPAKSRAAEPAPPPAPPPAADTATLRITSDVPGAQVFIDRQFIGATPVTAEHIAPGTHQLNASVQGFDGVAESIEVTPGPRDIPLRFREVKLDAKIAVVHKHRFGSCAGQLVATPQGLRYDTPNKDDAFSVPLSDVETLDVDYLQKNLRVKLRKGRQYNFTDPEGNADRLFVFQRDVDKARQRLAHGDQPSAN